MAKKRIFTIGFELPGDDFEYVPFDSDQSLLDADIVLFEVGFGEHAATEHHQGEPCFDHHSSVRVSQNLLHWHSELVAATNVGKLVIVFLSKPRSYLRYTGQQQFSGTGRSRVTINIVARIESYSAVPNVTSAEAKSGREVQLTREGVYLSSYWKEFEDYSPYEAYIDGKFTHVVLTTKTGNKTVAAAVHAKGVLLFLPPVRYDEEKFTKYDSKTKETHWTPEALKFGKRLEVALAALAGVILRGRSVTPPPTWALESSFSTTEEEVLHSEASKLTKEITSLQLQRTTLEQRLEKAGSIRALLYEQGKLGCCRFG